jgi:hypothetical protein
LIRDGSVGVGSRVSSSVRGRKGPSLSIIIIPGKSIVPVPSPVMVTVSVTSPVWIIPIIIRIIAIIRVTPGIRRIPGIRIAETAIPPAVS